MTFVQGLIINYVQLLLILCIACIQAASISAVCCGVTKVFAHKIPDPATAGTPIPGIVLSPTRYNPGIGVLAPGNNP